MVGGEELVAVFEVVGGVDDGDAGGVDEGFERFGDVGGGADAEDDVAGVGAAERLGFAVGVEPGEVDFEEVVFGVPADGVDLVGEVESGEVVGDPAAVGVVFGALDVEALGEVEGEEAVAVLEVVEEGPGAGGVGEGHQVGEEGDLEGGAVDEEAGVPVEAGALFVEDGVEFGEGLGEGGEGEVEGADADAHQVAGCFGGGSLGVGRRAHRGVCPSTSFRSVARSPGRVWGLRRVALSQRRPSRVARPRTARPSSRRVRRTAATVSSVALTGRNRTVLMTGRS